MLVLSRKKDEQVFVGAVPGNQGVPLVTNVDNIIDDKVKLGYGAETSSGDPTALLTIHRDEVFNNSSPQYSESSGPNLNDFDPKFNARGIKQTDKPLLESFISHLGIQGAETLGNLKSKLNNLEFSDNLINFISYVRNGAFFKHWADHYAEQAKKMASSLGLTA